MKMYLLVGIAVAALAFAANQVMSEVAPNSGEGTKVANASIVDKVQVLRDGISQFVESTGRDGSTDKEIELLAALDRYLAEDSLDKIITQLQEFVDRSPSSPEAAKAAAAIEILKRKNPVPARDDYQLPEHRQRQRQNFLNRRVPEPDSE